MSQQQSANPKNKTDATTRALYGLVIALVIGIIGITLFIIFDRLLSHPFSMDEVEDFDGTIDIEPPRDMPDFTLTNQHGEPMSLSDLRGRYVLLTFGYTHCPDVCPLTLNEFRRIRESLGELAAHVAFVFVSVDGQRDTPQVIRAYFATRQLEGIIGLTGPEADVRQLGADYGLAFGRNTTESQTAYLVSHTAGSFLLDPQGRWMMRYQFGVMPSLIAADLKTFMAS